MGARRVNSSDVAKAAGVSRTTVSFVLNNSPNQQIPPATRARVLAAAEELHYSPSPEARLLSTGASDIVLFLVPDWAPSKHISIYLNYLTQLLAEHGLVGLTHLGYSDEARIEGAWKSLTARAVVPFFTLPESDQAAITRSGSPILPMEWFQRTRDDEPVLQRAIGRRQAQVLLDHGLRRAAYIAPADPKERSFVQVRYDGFREVMTEATGEEPPCLFVESSQTALREALAAAVTTKRDSVAVFGAQLAVAVSWAAASEQVRIPADLAVLSSDDDDLLDFTSPPTAAIRLDLHEMARLHIRSIVTRLNGEADDELVPPLALVRRNSLPPAAD